MGGAVLMTALFDVVFGIGRIARRGALRPEDISVGCTITRDARSRRIRAIDGRFPDATIAIGPEGHFDAGVVAVDSERHVKNSGKNEWHGREYTAVPMRAQAEASDGA